MSYKDKIESRKARMLAKAKHLRRMADVAYNKAKSMSDLIPFGQPIHIGHHSEGRDRRFRASIFKTYGKSFELLKRAETYEERASRVGGGGISGLDPDALHLLRAKLQDEEKSHAAMKAANVIIRKGMPKEETVKKLVELGFGDKMAEELVTPGRFGGLGFAGFSLTNSLARIKHTKDRISTLEKLEARKEETRDKTGGTTNYMSGDGWEIREDLEDMRYHVIFNGKPNARTREVLKSNAFKWSPNRNAWVRQITSGARYALETIKKHLKESTIY